MSLIAGCDLTSEIAATRCLDCLNRSQKEALQAHFLALALQAYGGADLRVLATRNKTIACVSCLPDFRLGSVMTAVAQKRAAAAGASVDLPIDQLLASVRCSGQGTQNQLDQAAIVYLNCALAQLGR